MFLHQCMQHEVQARRARILDLVPESYITGISETWWEDTCNTCVAINGSWLFRRAREGGTVSERGAGLHGAQSW